MSNPIDNGRRKLLKAGAMGAASIPLASLVASGTAMARIPDDAEDLPEAEDGHAHDYVNVAEDASDHPRFEQGQYCDNCTFWEGEVKNGWGFCSHPDFSDVLVKDEGWCGVYAPAS